MGNYKDSDRSRFATTLARLLDETDLFKREEWARVLDITPQAISHWVNDKAVPRAELLRRILDVLTNATGVPQDILREFYAVCREPATKVSPLHGDRMGKTVGHYLVTPVMQGFLRALNPLPPQQQEEVLYQASDLCWQLQVGDYHPPAAVMSREISAPALAGTVVCDSQHASAPSGRVEDAEYLLDEEEEDTFTKTEVITGKTQAKMLHRYRGLSPVNSSNGDFGEVGKFDLKPQGRTLAGLSASYVVVLLHFRKGENVFSSFPLDEMMFFLLQGQVSWRYEGYDRTLSLGTGVGEPQLTWVSAAGRKGAPRGLPPFRVYSEGDESAVGLAVLYARTGVPLRELSTYQKDRKVELDGRDWTAGEVESYWKIAKKVLPHSGLPFVGRVPTELEELSAFVEKHRIIPDPEDRKRHDIARLEDQLHDAYLPDWKANEARLRPRIIKARACPDDNIRMDYHPGREVILPLQGAFKSFYAKIPTSMWDSNDFVSCKFAPGQLRREFVQSAAVSGDAYSDVLLLCSSNAHGFSGVDNEDAYGLLIDCPARPFSSHGHGHAESGSEGIRDAGGKVA